jgi:16S rRNA (cytosine967-C5)-methyltransferase
VATRVLVRVEKDHAFAAAALEAELSRAATIEARDRALATELVYGTLRVAPWLDEQIGRYLSSHRKSKLEPRVHACLLLAAYQLFFTRVPAFAAVHEAVDAVNEARGTRVGAFANAVLRNVAAQAAAKATDAGTFEDAIIASTPEWLRDALERSLGATETRAFLRCAAQPPAVALRVDGALCDPAERDVWIERLRAAAPGASFEPGRASPLAILARGAGRPQRLPGFAEGAWSIQEEGSQVAALSMGVRLGDTVLDACAGRGNKTSLLVRAAGASGAVDACDASPAKLERLSAELMRVGLSPRRTHAVDWCVGSGDVTGEYDRVLVDAPCSGTGTLRRRPEIALRRQPEDLAALARVQAAIVRRVAQHVRPGGTLVYVVCSVLREEGEEVIEGLRDLPDFDFSPGVRLTPHEHGTDGYFIAKLVRRSLRSGRATL